MVAAEGPLQSHQRLSHGRGVRPRFGADRQVDVAQGNGPALGVGDHQCAVFDGNRRDGCGAAVGAGQKPRQVPRSARLAAGMNLQPSNAEAAKFGNVGDEVGQVRVAFAEDFVDVGQQLRLLSANREAEADAADFDAATLEAAGGVDLDDEFRVTSTQSLLDPIANLVIELAEAPVLERHEGYGGQQPEEPQPANRAPQANGQARFSGLGWGVHAGEGSGFRVQGQELAFFVSWKSSIPLRGPRPGRSTAAWPAAGSGSS